jgi:hypothetical protein
MSMVTSTVENWRRGFPFSIVYLVRSDDTVIVIAIPHHAREPGYWKKRST